MKTQIAPTKSQYPFLLNTSVIAHRLAVQDPCLALVEQLYARMARILTPTMNDKLVGIGQQLVLQEWLNPSLSSLQLQSRVRAAVSSALKTGILMNVSWVFDGEDVAIMAVIIILMMVEDGNQDLQQAMMQAEAMMQVKQAIRNLLNSVEQAEATAQCQSSLFREALVSLARTIWRKWLRQNNMDTALSIIESQIEAAWKDTGREFISQPRPNCILWTEAASLKYPFYSNLMGRLNQIRISALALG
jgi:hypothetical protein